MCFSFNILFFCFVFAAKFLSIAKKRGELGIRAKEAKGRMIVWMRFLLYNGTVGLCNVSFDCCGTVVVRSSL